jgi:hypothetical protein
MLVEKTAVKNQLSQLYVLEYNYIELLLNFAMLHALES